MFFLLTERFPTFKFFPADVANLRWILSESSMAPFELSWAYLTAAPRRVFAELSRDRILLDLRALVLGLLVRKAEKFLAYEIHQFINVPYERIRITLPQEQ